MNVWDILILLLIGLMLCFAVRAVRGGKTGSCHDCKSCSHNCAACQNRCNQNDRP